jgi:hypothetical protein
LREKLAKIGEPCPLRDVLTSHVRCVTFQMVEAAVPRQVFAEILSLIARLRAPTCPA